MRSRSAWPGDRQWGGNPGRQQQRSTALAGGSGATTAPPSPPEPQQHPRTPLHPCNNLMPEIKNIILKEPLSLPTTQGSAEEGLTGSLFSSQGMKWLPHDHGSSSKLQDSGKGRVTVLLLSDHRRDKCFLPGGKKRLK